MATSTLLPDILAVEPGWLTIALFSQPDCVFCKEVREHYLKPLLAARPRHLAAAEFQLNGLRRIKAWSQGIQSEAEFARQQKAHLSEFKWLKSRFHFGTLMPLRVGASIPLLTDFAYGTGLRVSELVGATLGQIETDDHDDPWLSVVGKGGRSGKVSRCRPWFVLPSIKTGSASRRQDSGASCTVSSCWPLT